MIDFSTVKPKDKIKYVGSNWIAYSGEYTVHPIESTYARGKCPETEKGKLVIVEFMNDDTPMFFNIMSLNPQEWEKVENE